MYVRSYLVIFPSLCRYIRNLSGALVISSGSGGEGARRVMCEIVEEGVVIAQLFFL